MAVWPVLAAWLENSDSFLDRSSLKEQLKQFSKSELIKIILEMADKIFESRELLKEESPDLDTLLESVDHIFAEAGTAGSRATATCSPQRWLSPAPAVPP